MQLFFTYIIPLLLICCGSSTTVKDGHSGKENRSVYFDRIVRKYGNEKALLAIYFTTTCMSDFKKSRNLRGKRVCSLQQDVMAYYTSNEEKIKNCLSVKDTARALKWCLADKKLNRVNVNNEGSHSFEEVLFTMKNGRAFFRPFLKDSVQYYGSLDFEQSCALYFNVVLFLADATDKKSNDFFKEYYDTYTALAGKD